MARKLIIAGYALRDPQTGQVGSLFATRLRARDNAMRDYQIVTLYLDENERPHFRTELTDKDDEAERKSKRGGR